MNQPAFDGDPGDRYGRAQREEPAVSKFHERPGLNGHTEVRQERGRNDAASSWLIVTPTRPPRSLNICVSCIFCFALSAPSGRVRAKSRTASTALRRNPVTVIDQQASDIGRAAGG
jgi:hypothetical protein